MQFHVFIANKAVYHNLPEGHTQVEIGIAWHPNLNLEIVARTTIDLQLRRTAGSLEPPLHIAALVDILARIVNPDFAFIAADDSQLAGTDVHPDQTARREVGLNALFGEFRRGNRLLCEAEACDQEKHAERNNSRFHLNTSRGSYPEVRSAYATSSQISRKFGFLRWIG